MLLVCRRLESSWRKHYKINYSLSMIYGVFWSPRCWLSNYHVNIRFIMYQSQIYIIIYIYGISSSFFYFCSLAIFFIKKWFLRCVCSVFRVPFSFLLYIYFFFRSIYLRVAQQSFSQSRELIHFNSPVRDILRTSVCSLSAISRPTRRCVHVSSRH